MRYLPIHVDTQDAIIRVIGGGEAAEAKLRTLIKTEAVLEVIAEEISPEIERWHKSGQLTWYSRGFQESDIYDARLIYAATEDDDINAHIAQQCSAKNILVNAADQKQACDFITPALVDRSPVLISIGTEGTSPGLARALKAPSEYIRCLGRANQRLARQSKRRDAVLVG